MLRRVTPIAILLLVACGGPDNSSSEAKRANAVNGDIVSQTLETDWQTLHGDAPLVIAHRGASGYRPEHTLAAYDLAIDMGADFIEPDLVITRDGHLVARHDRYLSMTTNVAEKPEFTDRKTLKPGHDAPDWYVEDFTLQELKTLRAIQPRTSRSKDYDGQYTIPTLDEVLALVSRRSKELDRRIGVYPETKQPSALLDLGLSFDKPLLESLNAHGFETANDPVFIQSFEAENLRRLSGLTDVRLVYLTAQVPEAPLAHIAAFADGIGPHKKLLLDQSGTSTGFVTAAHNAGLVVHPWTFRDDDIDPAFKGDIKAEINAYIALGIDGYFTDFPDTGVNAVKAHTLP